MERKECTINGVDYISAPPESKIDWCLGCAAYDDGDLCAAFDDCAGFIWVEKDK